MLDPTVRTVRFPMSQFVIHFGRVIGIGLAIAELVKLRRVYLSEAIMKSIFFFVLFNLLTISQANAEVTAEDGYCKIETNVSRSPWGQTQLAVTLNDYFFYQWNFYFKQDEKLMNYYALKSFAELGISGLCHKLPVRCSIGGTFGPGVYLGSANFPLRAYPGAQSGTWESARITLEKLQDFGICEK
jgi:hypothetical protein